MSVYNAEKFLKESIESILTQTYTDFEFLIINDGSTDNSAKILNSYTDPRIRIIHQKNMGLTKSLNRAIQETHGIYIARMDADDIALPKRLEKQINFLETNPHIVMCGTQAIHINASGEYLNNFNCPQSYRKILSTILFHNPFIHSSICIRREIITRAGMYNTNFRYMQDYELWTRIVPFYTCENLVDRLLLYRTTETSITTLKRRAPEYRWWKLKIRIFCVVRLIQSIILKISSAKT